MYFSFLVHVKQLEPYCKILPKKKKPIPSFIGGPALTVVLNFFFLVCCLNI